MLAGAIFFFVNLASQLLNPHNLPPVGLEIIAGAPARQQDRLQFHQ